MHFCLLFISKELPTDDYIFEKLSRFSEYKNQIYDENEKIDIKKYPFTFDALIVGGRYGGMLKYKTEEEDYMFYGKPLNKVKIRSNLFDNLQDYYNEPFALDVISRKIDEVAFIDYLGFREGFIYCDGCRISQILNKEEIDGYCLYDAVTDSAYSRESWDGENYIENKSFENVIKEALELHKEDYLTIIDLHD